MDLDRRSLIAGIAATLGLSATAWADAPASTVRNVVFVRFGGGVRRRESIVPATSCSPFLLQGLLPQGTLFDDMVMDPGDTRIQTSHGQGTLYLLTGRYYDYNGEQGAPLAGEKFVSPYPTLLELMRAAGVPRSQVAFVNGENRPQEEHYALSQHPDFGPAYQASMLSRRAFERFRATHTTGDPVLDAFWEEWEAWWGTSGTLHPRGDRLITELGLWALERLQPRFLMLNYNDCDYVHWGNPEHYTRGVAIMDRGVQRIVSAIDRLEAYRDNTLLVVAPDCGRDHNRALAVPFQHHFGDAVCREVFAYFRGPGVPKGRVVSRRTQQVDVMPTIAAQLGLSRAEAEGDVLEEVWG